MSNLSSYSLIDDDHIDDQETINVGNLIIDLESDLEKEKIENEQANAKPTNRASTTGAPTSSTTSSSSSSSSSLSPSATSFAAKASSSTSANSCAGNNSAGGSSTSATLNLNPLTALSGKSNQKSSGKLSSISTSSNNNNNINNANNNTNSISAINSSITTTNSSSSNNNNNGHLMTTRTVFKSLADERGELKMIITRETKPGKSEHKIVTSPNQKSPTSSSSSTSMNENNTTSHANNYEDLQAHNESTSKPPQSSSSISSTRECGTSTSIGTITEPDCLGPCEPGTSVTLEGIVWQETEGGILVVNVTWRGKTYVGALLDCTRHDWAPPRLCDSPTSDIDSKANKGVRTKRIVTRSNGTGLDEKNLLQTTGKLRNGKGRRILTSNDLTPCNKRQRDSDKSSNENLTAQSEANTLLTNVSTITNSENACVPMNIDTTLATNNESISTSNILTDKAGPNSPIMIGCSEPNCSKKFRNTNGLMYHKTHAHGVDNIESNNAQDNDCSSSVKDKVEISIKGNQSEQKQDIHHADSDHQSPKQNIEPSKHIEDSVFPVQPRYRTPSPQLTAKINSNKSLPDSSPNSNAIHNIEPRPKMLRVLDSDRRSSLDVNHGGSNTDFGRRSPGTSRHPTEQGRGFNNHSAIKLAPSGASIVGVGGGSTISNPKQINPSPIPVATEEGMKPSGTSTGPPPAPHQANCYFNSAFLANTFNPYGIPPYFPRPPLPLYEPLVPPTSSTNPAFLSRFLNNLRVPPPPPPQEPSSRLLNPPMSKNPMLPPTPLPPYPPPNSYPPFPPPASHPPFPPPTK